MPLVSFSDVSVRVPNVKGLQRHLPSFLQRNIPQKEILHSVGGVFPRKGLVAVLGPSGSSKTTLLNTISNRMALAGSVGMTAYGEVCVNNVKVSPEFFFSKKVSFVPQETCLFAELTPRESIRYATRFTYPHWGEQQIEEHVNGIITALNINKCADSSIGNEMFRGISGGEAKRTSIGVNIVNQPEILILDEPTTGLDSETATLVVRSILNLASTNPEDGEESQNSQAGIPPEDQEGRLIVMTLHQPSSEIWEMIEHVVLMAEGHIVYNGPTKEAVPYFASLGFVLPSNTNPADFFLDVVQMAEDDVGHVPFQEKRSFFNGSSSALVPAKNGSALTISTQDAMIEAIKQDFDKPSLQATALTESGNQTKGSTTIMRSSNIGMVRGRETIIAPPKHANKYERARYLAGAWRHYSEQMEKKKRRSNAQASKTTLKTSAGGQNGQSGGKSTSKAAGRHSQQHKSKTSRLSVPGALPNNASLGSRRSMQNDDTDDVWESTDDSDSDDVTSGDESEGGLHRDELENSEMLRKRERLRAMMTKYQREKLPLYQEPQEKRHLYDQDSDQDDEYDYGADPAGILRYSVGLTGGPTSFVHNDGAGEHDGVENSSSNRQDHSDPFNHNMSTFEVFVSQLRALTSRSWKTFIRTKMMVPMKVFQIVLSALLVIALYCKFPHDQQSVLNRASCMYLLIIIQIFATVLSVALVFPNERGVYVAEQAARLYWVFPYYISKLIIDLPILTATIIAFSVVCYFAVGFQYIIGKFVLHTIVLEAIACIGHGLGLVVASAVPSPNFAVLLAPMAIAPFILFSHIAIPSGYVLPFLRPLQYLSPFWWGLDALMLIEFTGLKLGCKDDELYAVPGIDSLSYICRFEDGHDVLTFYDVKSNMLWPSIIVLYAIAGALIFLSGVTLQFLSVQISKSTPMLPASKISR